MLKETVNILKHESFFFSWQVKKRIRLNVNQSTWTRLYRVITYSMLVCFINVLSRDGNKTKFKISLQDKKNIFDKYFTKCRK